MQVEEYETYTFGPLGSDWTCAHPECLHPGQLIENGEAVSIIEVDDGADTLLFHPDCYRQLPGRNTDREEN